MKTSITDCWKSDRFLLFTQDWKLNRQSLTTTFSDKYKTSEAKFNEKRQNLGSDVKIGQQNYKQSKNVE